MDDEISDEECQEITHTLVGIKTAEEKTAKIQEDPAENGAENGLNAEEHDLLKYSDITSIAGEEILNKDERADNQLLDAEEIKGLLPSKRSSKNER